MSERNVCGIPCSLKSAKHRKAIREVLSQIRARAPADFARIRGRVRKIRPVSKKEAGKGAAGSWLRSLRKQDYWDPRMYECHGLLSISEKLEAPQVPAVAAHEFGHVCTTYDDIDRRDAFEGWFAEMLHEMCADRYAYKWGFGRDIARYRKLRHFWHHGPTPGSDYAEEVGRGADRIVNRYKVTKNFYIHFVQCETPDGRIIETAKQRKERLLREFEKKMAERGGLPPFSRPT